MSRIFMLKMQKDYPFGQLSSNCQSCHKVIVTRKINANGNDKQKLINKAKILRQLQQDSIVHLDSFKEDGQQIEFNYQYVPIKFEIWMKKLTLSTLQKFQQQLFHFIYFLSYNKILVRIRPSCIGLTSDYNLKYFLDFDFLVDYQGCKNMIFQNYKKQVDKLCALLSKRISTPEGQLSYTDIMSCQKNQESLTFSSKNHRKARVSQNLSLKIFQNTKNEDEKFKQYNPPAQVSQFKGNDKKEHQTSYQTKNKSSDKTKSKQVLEFVPDKLLAQAREILGISLNWRLSNENNGNMLILGKQQKIKQNKIYNKNTEIQAKIQEEKFSDQINKKSKKYQQEYFQCNDLDQSVYFQDFLKVLDNDSPKRQTKAKLSSLSTQSTTSTNIPIKNKEQEDIKSIQKKVFDAINNSVLIMNKFKSKKN